MNREHGVVALLVLGVGLILASFYWAGWRDGRGEWTEDRALRHQTVSRQLHQKSFAPPANAEEEAQLAALRTEFETLSGALTVAQRRGASEAFWLGAVGAGLVVAALVMRVMQTRSSGPRRGP